MDRKSPINSEKDLDTLKRRLVEKKAQIYMGHAKERDTQANNYDRDQFSDYANAFVTDSANKQIAAAFKDKLTELEQRAGAGDKNAISALLNMYREEGLDPKVYPHPMEIIRAQAEKGNVFAEECMAIAYEQGLAGLRKNQNTAKEWLKKAALHGSKDAKKTLHANRFALGVKMSIFLILVIVTGIGLGIVGIFPSQNDSDTGLWVVLAVLAVIVVASIVSIVRKRYLLIWIFLLMSIVGAYIFFKGMNSPAAPATEETTQTDVSNDR